MEHVCKVSELTNEVQIFLLIGCVLYLKYPSVHCTILHLCDPVNC